ncbi:MAG: (d)CMP kinase [Acidobacteriota bacterium]
MKKLIIAIDGPSGAGKSTAGKALASRLGYLYIDTGAMYRVAALAVLRQAITFDAEEQIIDLVGSIRIGLEGEPYNLHLFLDGEDVTDQIRTPEVSQAASKISAINGVRQVLVEQQRDLGKQGGVVMDGRDIGTHVFPNADIKFFLVADIEERARRRNLEEQSRGENLTLTQTLHEIQERDQRDSQRTYSPLRPAPDSIQLNTSNLSPTQVIDKMLELIEQRNRLGASPSGAN